jgi:hypothetical protein
VGLSPYHLHFLNPVRTFSLGADFLREMPQFVGRHLRYAPLEKPYALLNIELDPDQKSLQDKGSETRRPRSNLG